MLYCNRIYFWCFRTPRLLEGVAIFIETPGNQHKSLSFLLKITNVKEARRISGGFSFFKSLILTLTETYCMGKRFLVCISFLPRCFFKRVSLPSTETKLNKEINDRHSDGDNKMLCLEIWDNKKMFNHNK